jgi:RNA polymerase sigma-70 factor (ECF subfamily)
MGMDTGERADLEEQIKAACTAGDFGDAATVAVRGYGPEIVGYLAAVTRSESDAGEIFSAFCEDMWKGLPTFRWDCTFRTWAYTVARHAWLRYVRDPLRRPGRAIPLSSASEVMIIAEKVRTQTLDYLRTEIKDRVAALRDKLDPEDQSLLLLRVNRKLAWRDIARILTEDEDLTDAAIEKKSASLRKRFERIKESLREMAGGQTPGGE